ncbi:E3 ubiquitin-protein ligase Ubr3 [Eumeta japonica]|uniref:E3 ubiquitin-protein ligase Ubr3 n=1 Tax=Eumeta variegata TaxID=151549 RepID=A0A4C1U5U0_EUMVA|nr:E3 ubiquitin-protein ligase Ubr3 [Eumeta japonica]
MSNSTAQVLMKKGKRGAAAYIHADCSSGSPQHLGPLLDVLLNPNKAIVEWETLDWCRWLIAGGRTPDEFATVVVSFMPSITNNHTALNTPNVICSLKLSSVECG